MENLENVFRITVANKSVKNNKNIIFKKGRFFNLLQKFNNPEKLCIIYLRII